MNAPLEAVTTDKAERNETIDVAKGIGILLVVMGHIFILLREYPSLSRGIYLFHMPLFFYSLGWSSRHPTALARGLEVERNHFSSLTSWWVFPTRCG